LTLRVRPPQVPGQLPDGSGSLSMPNYVYYSGMKAGPWFRRQLPSAPAELIHCVGQRTVCRKQNCDYVKNVHAAQQQALVLGQTFYCNFLLQLFIATPPFTVPYLSDLALLQCPTQRYSESVCVHCQANHPSSKMHANNENWH